MSDLFPEPTPEMIAELLAEIDEMYKDLPDCRYGCGGKEIVGMDCTNTCWGWQAKNAFDYAEAVRLRFCVTA
jgi:hypothetical protein